MKVHGIILWQELIKTNVNDNLILIIMEEIVAKIFFLKKFKKNN